MQKWEYYTSILEANTDVGPVPVPDDIAFTDHPHEPMGPPATVWPTRKLL